MRKKPTPEPEKKKRPGRKLSAEERRKLAEKARKQWADPEGKLRKRNQEVHIIKPPRDAAERIAHCVATYGSTKELLANHFDIDISVFDRWLRDHDDIRRAYEESKGIEHSKLISVLFDQAMSGNASAAMFLLKIRHQYRDSGPLPGETADPTAVAARVQATVKAMLKIEGIG
ncbi:MAG: hypothetical protein NTX13_10955 [Acidobacteria bacterium]|nr:hypothetical protein [Acidobacteriota bacterium]